MIQILFANLLTIIALMTLLWLISIRLRDVSIIDLFWGPGFVVIAWVTLVLSKEVSLSSLILPILVTIWGVRLAIYLTIRNWGHGEDKRYVAMREHRGNSFWWQSYFIVFLLQAAVMCFVSLPLQLIDTTAIFHPLHLLGGLIWLTGLLFESIGDAQLMAFKADPANQGKVLDHGLWKYTRHPNYFGDFLVWWGLFLVAVASGAPWWTAIGPATMSVFLIQVSGVKLTEQNMQSTKPQYRDYMLKTNAFFPGLPKQLDREVHQ